MKLLDRLFGRGDELDAKGPVSVPLTPLLATMAETLDEVAGSPPELLLIRAQLADAYRAMEVEPMDPAAFDALAARLDEGAQSRLGLLALVVRRGTLRKELKALLALHGQDAAAQVRGGFVNVAYMTPLLALDLMQKSPLRLEELTRRWLSQLGAGVKGETEEISRAALDRLDYGRLLAEAERARQAAEERMEQLKKLQEQRDGARAPRGKW